MTSSIDLMKHIIEFGDAYVPFPFDMHALIFPEDTPALERRFRIANDQHGFNKINNKNIPLRL